MFAFWGDDMHRGGRGLGEIDEALFCHHQVIALHAGDQNLNIAIGFDGDHTLFFVMTGVELTVGSDLQSTDPRKMV